MVKVGASVDALATGFSSPGSPGPKFQTSGAENAQERAANCPPRRIFLLSPAHAGGVRGKQIRNADAAFGLAVRMQREGLPLGELFSFISGLYFRGKLAYAQAFAQPPPGVPGVVVITACRGLLPADKIISVPELEEMLAVPIAPSEPRYRRPLEREARLLAERAGEGCAAVLLGSIATPKYVEPLLPIWGERLLFPSEFVGRGDMSRGGLMLRHVRAGRQLNYIPVATAVHRGSRPPKLPKPTAGNGLP